MRRPFVVPAVVTALAGGLVAAAPSGPAVAAPAKPDLPAEVLAEYREQFPDVPAERLYERLSLTPARKKLLERYGAEHAATFGGSWYDYRTGEWHLLATSDEAAEAVAAPARAAGVTVRTRVVRYSAADLRARADRIRAGKDPLSAASGGRAGVDLLANRVTVAASPAGAADDPMVTFVGAPAVRPTEQACTDRRNCGAPMRTGIILWRDSYSSPKCSLGFTARGDDGAYWAYTAGHCVGTINETWGHGGQYLGLARQCGLPGLGPFVNCISTNEVDVARIRISNSYWTSGTFGHVFYNPSTMVDLDYAIQARATIETDDVVCISSWHNNYTGFTSGWYSEVSTDTCGTIESPSDASYHGMPRVGGTSTCGGDSGGGWLFYPGNGERWGYGVHSAALVTQGQNCSYGKDAWFSAVPSINTFTDANSATEIRILTR